MSVASDGKTQWLKLIQTAKDALQGYIWAGKGEDEGFNFRINYSLAYLPLS